MFFKQLSSILKDDDKLSSIRIKLQDKLNIGTSSPKQGRDRKFVLTFNSPIAYPPPLPSFQCASQYFSVSETEHSEQAFSFYYEEFEETFNAPSYQVQEQIPNIAEPADGMHPYGMDLNQYQGKRFQSPIQDVKPHFLRGVQTPIKVYNQVAAHQRILSFQELQSCNHLNQITYVCIRDTPLTTKTKKMLFKKLALCSVLETLILKNINIGSLSQNIRFPNLRFVDLSQNRIKNFSGFRKLTKYSPNLEILDLSANPIAATDDFAFKLVQKLFLLESVNQKFVPVDDRIRAINLHGSYEQRNNVERTRWELMLDGIQEIREFRAIHPGWQPAAITQISFPNTQLRYFYVGNLVNILHLDLSNNMITDISTGGLEKCEYLQYCSFRNNQLFRQDTVDIFEYTPSIRIVHLDMNVKLVGYRQKLVYVTRNCRGTNRTLGLVQIDQEPVSLAEKVSAVEAFEPTTPATAAGYKWKLLIIEKYGHRQLQTIPNLLGYVKKCAFPKLGLMIIDVAAFTNVEIIDFSNNQLTSFTGIGGLKKLRVLLLTDNPNLDTQMIAQQLSSLDSLESFSFSVTQQPTTPTNAQSSPAKSHHHHSQPTLLPHPRSGNSKEYRAKVLAAIIPRNKKFLLLDNTGISYSERVQAYADAGYPTDVVEKYRFLLALTINCTLPFNRGIHPEQVEIGNQYDPTMVTSLRRLRDWGLVSNVVNLSLFPNLKEVDLANNRLTDIALLGLHNLSKLEKLSLINNQINNPLQVIAQVLDSIPTLEIVALRGNPAIKTPADRQTLIGYMASMKSTQTTLKVIDTEITIHDKVDGWKLAGAPIKEAEAFRLSYIAKQKSIDFYNIAHLELCDCALEYLDLGTITTLLTLLMPNNRFQTLANIKGLSDNKELFALDVRFNNLSSLEDTSEQILPISGLMVLGIQGNPFISNNPTQNKAFNYRSKFLSLVRPLYQEHLFPLSILDSSEITCEELAEAAVSTALKGDTNAKKDLVFSIAILRRTPANIPCDQLYELDLKGTFISHLNLSRFPNLVILSLSDNKISDNNLKDSHISSLQQLKALDLRNNKLKDLALLCKLMDTMSIETLFVEENPCFDLDNQKDRVRFFKKTTNPKLLNTLKYLNGILISSVDTCKFSQTKSAKRK
ncbi:hypothetical protein CYY_005929 [Polysphondylium violaceum]|uniref:Leucine-rich repeat-containing protein n=1 Tax=Polysphondylium violaceum TaxID=133409 RepID=A0A8J4UZB4_9MYCE|nr:hypothetical protein CYY_005929 [Polysphondylium violaceum]